MTFSYRQAIREIVFAPITCRPDILYSIIKLSQYNNKPAKIYYIAVKRVFKFLRDNIDGGLHYWGPMLNLHQLLLLPDPAMPSVNYDINVPGSTSMEPLGFVDSNWTGDTYHRHSISSMAFLGCAPVVYRSCFQPTVSMSSTKVEFITAVEVGKLTLYLRSMLDELSITQDAATRLRDDNDATIAIADSQRPARHT